MNDRVIVWLGWEFFSTVNATFKISLLKCFGIGAVEYIISMYA